ncbi:phage terminase large subunit [Maritimibacter harenae]|uniref:phage terminase large subunit n=1 Tax=Maritimibacter harenae TaxID=2606218 RepID=UPI002E2A8F38|nr:phage terminase large subunit [Maritimibacter harenae]
MHTRARGEALFPERADLEWLEQSRKEMGSVVFNCQYQQNPIAPDGSPLKWEWFKTYEERLQRDRYQLVVQSWDTGMSANPNAACSVCTTWGFTDNVWHLLDVFRDRLDYPDLLKKVRRSADEWRADEVIIEKAATGIPLLQDCRREDRARFLAETPYEDKEIRFNRSLAAVEAGKIYLPREAHWLPAFKRELQAFPRGNLKDQVDSFSQFINWLQSHRFFSALGRDHPINVGRREKVMARRERRPRR